MRAMGALTSTAAENQALWNLRSRRLCSVRKKAAVELPRLQTYEKLLVYFASSRQWQGGLCPARPLISSLTRDDAKKVIS